MELTIGDIEDSSGRRQVHDRIRALHGGLHRRRIRYITNQRLNTAVCRPCFVPITKRTGTSQGPSSFFRCPLPVRRLASDVLFRRPYSSPSSGIWRLVSGLRSVICRLPCFVPIRIQRDACERVLDLLRRLGIK
jgi:hypothetical protein